MSPAIQFPSTVRDLKFKHVYWQFRKDVVDKEVQSAATYSYLWLADQAGHIGLGIIFTIILGVVLQLELLSRFFDLLAGIGLVAKFLPTLATLLHGLATSFHSLSDRDQLNWIAFIGFPIGFFWESGVFAIFRCKQTRLFPSNTLMLARNAFAAAFYMALGVAIGVAWYAALLSRHSFKAEHLTRIDFGITLACVATAFVYAYEWVRQKIIWQKAGIPFLFRLANVDRTTVTPNAAKDIQNYIDAHLRQKRSPHPPAIMLTGELSSGKTSLACGIATEAAFRSLTARYVTFDKLVQTAKDGQDDHGPRNIQYWPWKDSDVLVIDDVDSRSSHDKFMTPREFTDIISQYKLTGTLGGKITVWVLGSIQNEEREETERTRKEWADAISNACKCVAYNGQETNPKVITVQLGKFAHAPGVASMRENCWTGLLRRVSAWLGAPLPDPGCDTEERSQVPTPLRRPQNPS